jgi:DeoR/GlpR family transcriptional regulator of sugar metabolism
VLAAQRQARIIELIRQQGAVRVADLTVELSVSDMTIRRDLDALARRGLIDKVHGGATGRDFGSTEEPGFAAKSLRAHDEKEAIAAVAAGLVEPGMAIGLSAGTTTWTLAHRLVAVPDITVVTNSMLIAGVFHSDPRSDQTIVLTGGIRTPSDALVGPLAVAALQSFNLDIVLMGVHGMDERSGFTTPNLAEAETERAFAQAGRRLVVVADHTKWGIVGISTFAELADADVLVTDEGLDGGARAKLHEHVGELVIAPVAEPDSGPAERSA